MVTQIPMVAMRGGKDSGCSKKPSEFSKNPINITKAMLNPTEYNKVSVISFVSILNALRRAKPGIKRR